LDKALALAGTGSRRACDELICAGRVSVDGDIVTNPLVRVDPQLSRILVDGSRVDPARDPEYLVVHKPRGVVATMHDPQGRSCLGDLVAAEHRGLFHVGRLDAEIAGLQIVMNDGELAQRLTVGAMPRTYLAQLPGPVPAGLGVRLRAGIVLDTTLVRTDDFRVVVNSPTVSMVEVSLHESVRHGARRLLTAAGCPPRFLVCIRVGPVVLGDLEAGQSRPLTEDEVLGLRGLVQAGADPDGRLRPEDQRP
jgi:23S rRNA pseudouridine2605 synthase